MKERGKKKKLEEKGWRKRVRRRRQFGNKGRREEKGEVIGERGEKRDDFSNTHALPVMETFFG